MNEPNSDERTWGMLAHLAAFGGLVVPVIGNVAGPLIVWVVKREQSAFVAEEAKEALNFNISVAIASLVCGALIYAAVGIPLGLALFLYWIVMTILAGIKAGEGIHYRYPLALRFVK